MKYRDSYEQIKELRYELKLLRKVFYDYSANISDKEFYKLRKRINEIKKKIKFIENMRKANEKVDRSK